MSEIRRVIIVCEGYFDRSFWRGWLTYLGCTSLDKQGGLMDPWGSKVASGHFGFYSRSRQSFIRLIPCEGDANVLREAKAWLAGLATRPVAHLVVNLDSDEDEDDPRATAAVDSVAGLALQFDSGAIADGHGDYLVAQGGTRVSALIWRESSAPSTRGVPGLQTLERLVCGALCEVYPERGEAVAAWLASRPALSPSSENKAHAWSHMAGWYAKRGCANFYEAIWEEPALVAAMRSRLDLIGAWRVAEMIAQ